MTEANELMQIFFHLYDKGASVDSPSVKSIDEYIKEVDPVHYDQITQIYFGWVLGTTMDWYKATVESETLRLKLFKQ